MRNSDKALVSGSDAACLPEQFFDGHGCLAHPVGKLRFKSTPRALCRVLAIVPSGLAVVMTHKV